jgi:hypothetical protein
METSQKAAAGAADKSSEVGSNVVQKSKELGQGAAEQTRLKEKE